MEAKNLETLQQGFCQAVIQTHVTKAPVFLSNGKEILVMKIVGKELFVSSTMNMEANAGIVVSLMRQMIHDAHHKKSLEPSEQEKLDASFTFPPMDPNDPSVLREEDVTIDDSELDEILSSLPDRLLPINLSASGKSPLVRTTSTACLAGRPVYVTPPSSFASRDALHEGTLSVLSPIGTCWCRCFCSQTIIQLTFYRWYASRNHCLDAD